MTFGRPAFIKKLLIFFFSRKPRKGKPSGRPGNSQSKSFSSQSPKYETYSFVQESADDSDYPLEVFLDEDGNIKQPLKQGVAFNYCSFDRWSMPDCVPGIQSKVSVQNFAHSPWMSALYTITVIFANDKYILLVLNKASYIEPDHKHFDIIEAHFVKRGIEHLVDRVPDPNSLTWNKKYGRTNQATRTSNVGPRRRKHSNVKITSHWDPALSGFSITVSDYTTGNPQIRTLKVAPGTWVWSG